MERVFYLRLMLPHLIRIFHQMIHSTLQVFVKVITKTKRLGSGILSMANIPRGSNLFIAHTISVIFNSLVTYYLIYRTFKEVKQHTQ